MVDKVPLNIYPFTTKDGKVIPLDIVRSKGIIKQTFTASSSREIAIPEGFDVALLYANQDCIFVNNDGTLAPPAYAGLVDNVLSPLAVFIPKGHAITVSVNPGIARVRGLTTNGFIIVQLIEKWAGLDLPITYIKR